MKYFEFPKRIVWCSALGLFLLGLVSCSVLDPADSSVNANVAPETQITSAPKPGATTSYYVTMAWKGEDTDGVVKGFNLVVDGQAQFVTRTDSTFRFTAANKDEAHSLSVAAVDDKGEVDPTPATLTFNARNVPPNTALAIVGNPAPGATFGRGGVFTILPIDDSDNGPEYSYRFKIDESGAWSAWLNAGEIEFSTASSFGLLPEGAHKFIAQVRDAAMAVDETPIAFAFVSSNTVKPTASVTTQVNNQSFYEDNSAFSLPAGNTVTFAWSVAFNYAGARSAGSRYRVDGGAWTEYSTATSALTLNTVATGAHSLEVEYQDIGGALSNIVKFDFELVTATLNQGILVVDDGNGQLAGRPPATGDTNVDTYYMNLLTALNARSAKWDILTQGNPTPKRGIGNYSTVMWVSDEATYSVLPRQTQLATDYFKLGGKMWIVGWRGVNQLAGTTPVVSFATGFPFIYDYLKLASTRQTPGNLFEFTGVTGANGHSNMNVDNPKNPIPGRNGLSPIDVFTVRGDVAAAQAIYTFNAFTGNPDYQGAITGMKYLGTDYKVVVFGFPLYHMKADEAQTAARKILQDLGEI